MVTWLDAAGINLGRSAGILISSRRPVLFCLALPLHLHFLIILGACLLKPVQVFPGLAVAGGMDDIKSIIILRPVLLFVLLGHELGGDMHFPNGSRAVAAVPQDLCQGYL